MTNNDPASGSDLKPSASPVKILKIIFVAVVLGGLWALILRQSHLVVNSINYLNWIVPAAGLVLFAPFLALAAVIFGGPRYFLLTGALSFGYLLFFPVNLYATLAVIFLFLGFWRAYYRTQFELRNNIKFSAHKIVRRVGSVIMLAFLLVISFNIWANVSEEMARDDSRLYSSLANLVTRSVLPVVERNLPGFHRSLTLDQYIVNGFASSLPQFQDLPAEARQGELEQSRQQLLAYLNVSAGGSEPLTDIAHRAVEAKLKEVLRPYAAFVPPIYGLVIFSLLRILAFFVEWLGLAIGALLFWSLRKTGFLKVTLTQITAEHVGI